MKTVGYLRVSTLGQGLEKNKADILRLANEKQLGHVDWVEEKVSGTVHWKEREIGKALLSLNVGDVIIVPELSRLGRSVLQILEIMQYAKEKGISVYAVKGGWSLNSSMESKIVLHMLAMLSEIERDLISERTKEALRVRKEKGVKLGRPKGPGKSKLDKHREEIVALLAVKSQQKFIAARYGVTPATLINWIKKNKIAVTPRPSGGGSTPLLKMGGSHSQSISKSVKKSKGEEK